MAKDKSKKKKDKKKKNKKKNRARLDPGPSVKDSEVYEKVRDQGASKQKAARIANASAGSSRKSVGRKGGKARAYDDWTKSDLYDKAKDVGIQGRSTMSKQELIDALRDS